MVETWISLIGRLQNGTAQPVLISAATASAIRTVVGLKPRHAAMPAATPPPS